MTVRGLRLAPFRGLRYAPERVSSLAAVTSPPYDVVVRPDGLRHLETADPYNIVRLILPQTEDPAARHRQAAETLRRWQADGVLARDPHPALYVYEQRKGDLLQRGLIGALRLSAPEEGVVLPHEGVIDEVVADRADLMREMAANPEPLLLSYRGDGTRTGATAVIERATRDAPLMATTTEDGFAHRLWAVTDPAELAEVDAELSRHSALIADGHHRWATYLRLRAEQGGPTGESPWDYGLVLLVDTARYPLQVRAIHRVLPRLPLKRALDLLDRAGAAYGQDGAFRVRTLEAPLDEALEELEDTAGNAFLLTEGEGVFHLLDRPSPALLARTVDARQPVAWRQLDATVLHSTLLDTIWQVPDRPEDIGYLHHVEAAVEQAAAHGGTAVLLRSVPESTVRGLAEQGITMPRKSTSFGPKPATGLVLRTLS
ncbi:DUF1015 family protein [Streptomyces smyrnaeus]|uniref:DUF1015 family protein n=1 Tax=Streptomyces TaxID=1883 RepID=UPI00161FEF54|nr:MULTISPECIES: DUF1015 domain-containing protein [unclassified Streptomyces]MBQ0868604.1 DUF1015 domain-containing protein [Streptomyces sp. RK75]MBQ1123604.1 DUF1015 domain-containing protein [Streptomyces sp. B15]MBQ1162314.1 DUF1015 domain-containing protein [Streptomyces sp. A73]